MPKLKGKKYEYTDKGITQYKKDKDRLGMEEGGELDSQMAEMMEEPTHTMPDGTEMTGASHKDYEEMMAEEPLVPDEEMEDDYTDFIIGESLTSEDEEYLLTALEQDDRLSMIFDQVVDTASEFTGSGPVEGPGSSVSDSIPARLSDGEFVMTSKSANKIGPDNLQKLMEAAELESDEEERQMKAIGGSIKGDEAAEVVSSTVLQEDPINLKNKETMRALDPRLSLFAS